MHLPPAASYPVVRSSWQRVAACVLAFCIGASVIAFGLVQASAFRSTALALVSIVIVALIFWASKNSSEGVLSWDGGSWHWSNFADVPLRSIEVHLDFQVLMLLKVKAINGKAEWLFLHAQSASNRWRALRRAIVGFHAQGGDLAARAGGEPLRATTLDS